MGREKKHHFVPASYLARFTRSGTDEGDIWVFDLDRAVSWPSTPRKTAHERDYNTLQIEGVDPLYVEKEVFGAIEGAAKQAFGEIITRGHEALARDMPGFDAGEETLQRVLAFAAAQSIRVPQIRQSLDKFNTDVVRMLARIMGSNREAFERAKADQPEMGDITFEEFQEFVKRADLRSEGTPTTHLAATLPSLTPVAKILRLRPWSLVFGPDDGPSYITSDDPVTLVAKNEDRFWGTGFGSPGSTVLLPLSRRVLLYGGPPADAAAVLPPPVLSVLGVNARDVAVKNTQLFLHAPAKVYSGEPEVAFALRDRIGGSEDLLRLCREHRIKPGDRT